MQTTASTMESIGHHGLPGLIRADCGRGPGMEYELTGCSDQLPSQFHLIEPQQYVYIGFHKGLEG